MVLDFLAPHIRHFIVIGLAAVLFVILSREPKDPHNENGFNQSADKKQDKTSGQKEDKNRGAERLFSEQELAEYDGRQGSKGLYLVILGSVYDVEKGAQHYGPGEAYHMFVGHDASRSFITGDFEEYDPEMSDVSSLTDKELTSLVKWKAFYDENYSYKGMAVGRYFDERGHKTEYHRAILKRADEDEPKQEFPSCNVEWTQDKGTLVWCTSRSGDGVERGWVGRPRRYLYFDAKTPACVCVPEEKERPDLLVPFQGCDPSSERCYAQDYK